MDACELKSKPQTGTPPAAVFCRDCGGSIRTRAGLRRPPRPVLCVACLERWPDLPFADRLLALRVDTGLTRAELARRAGVRLGTISTYESGRCDPGGKPLARLAALFGRLLLGAAPGKAGRPPVASGSAAGAWVIGPAHPDYARWQARVEAGAAPQPELGEPWLVGGPRSAPPAACSVRTPGVRV